MSRHKWSPLRAAGVALATIGLVGSLAACSAPAEQDGGTVTLNFAMPTPGEAVIALLEEAAKDFKAETGTAVNVNLVEASLYEGIGLPNLLTSNDAPDIFFEWTGFRLEKRAADGFATDLTDAVAAGPLKGMVDDGAWDFTDVDGAPHMVPYQIQVANVLWFNPELTSAAGVEPPKTWAELIDACDALNAKGTVPISMGNHTLWPVGNWFGHIAARVVGNDVYAAAMSGETGFDDPAWVEVFEYAEELREHKCLNKGVAADSPAAGYQSFFLDGAAMHASGAWLLTNAANDAPDKEFDFVNQPEMPNEKSPGSVMAVMTGFVVNDQSEHKEKAIDFLAKLNSGEYADDFVAAGAFPVSSFGDDSLGVNPKQLELNKLVTAAPAIVSPPDTGYDRELAQAFYQAVANVITGAVSAEDAPASITAGR